MCAWIAINPRVVRRRKEVELILSLFIEVLEPAKALA